MLIDLYEARAMLPKVGDTRWEHPTVDPGNGHQPERHAPQRCVVVEVNQAHLWYTVQFPNGIRESYKVPRHRSGSGGGSCGED